MLITKVVYNPYGDDSQNEWIELKNNRPTPLDVSDFKVGDEERYGGQEGMARFPANTIIEGNRVIVIAQTAAGFQAQTGILPDFELQESIATVPNMRTARLIASGDIGLANGGDEVIVMDGKNKIIDAISYGDSDFAFTPSIQPVPENSAIARVPANCDTDSAADWRPLASFTPYIVEVDPACDVELDPENDGEDGGEATETDKSETDQIRIGDLQGKEEVSAKVNQIVEYSGVVIGRHSDTNADGITFHTIFVQGESDDDPLTSDGLPAFTALDRTNLVLGDQVRVRGQMTEFYGLSEIADDGIEIEVIEKGQPLPEPISLSRDNLPNEGLEGMLVHIAKGIVAGPTFITDAGCGFAVIPADFEIDQIIRHSLETDIGPIIPVLYHDERRCAFMPALKRGDIVHNIQGPLTWNFDQWKIVTQPQFKFEIEQSARPPFPNRPTLSDNQISIVSYNLENFFDDFDDTESSAEPKPSAAEIETRISKFSHTIVETLNCPTIIGLQEVEKRHLLQKLTAAVEPGCGFVYEITHFESDDIRGIDNAYLTDPNLVTIDAARLRPTCSPQVTDIRSDLDCQRNRYPLFSRPPLQLEVTVYGQPLVLFVNHFKSKRGGEQETALRRLEQAKYINSLVAEQKERRDDPFVIVLGDFNDYADSATFKKMTEDGGLENVLRRLPAEEAYTFNFGGAAQLLDGFFLTPETAQLISDVQIFHINADFPDALQLDTTPENLPYKSTDHDLPYAVLDFSLIPEPEIAASSPRYWTLLKRSTSRLS